eukprot:4368251-Pyramimonas_sp.AAC.1
MMRKGRRKDWDEVRWGATLRAQDVGPTHTGEDEDSEKEEGGGGGKKEGHAQRCEFKTRTQHPGGCGIFMAKDQSDASVSTARQLGRRRGELPMGPRPVRWVLRSKGRPPCHSCHWSLR